MRFKTTLILLFLNIMAFAYLAWLSSRTDVQSVYDAESAVFLPGTEAIDVIRIHYKDKRESRELERTRTGWVLTKPLRWRANPNAVSKIISDLQLMRAQIRIPLDEFDDAEQSLTDYGLNPPAVTLAYASAKGDPVELKIGSATSLGERLYVRSPDGSEVVVTSRDVLDTLSAPLPELADLRIFDMEFGEVDTFSIQIGQNQHQLRKTDKKWAFETPVNAPADGKLVEAVIAKILSLEARALLSPGEVAPDVAGLDTPVLRVTLGGNGTREALAIGGIVGRDKEAEQGKESVLAYARLEGTQVPDTLFTVEAAPFDILKGSVEILREHRFLQFDVESVNAIELTQGERNLTLQKLEKRNADQPDDWQVIAKDLSGKVITDQADRQIVRTMLEQLNELNAERIVSDAAGPSDVEAWGFNEPLARLTLKMASEEKTLIVGRLSNEAPRFIYAKLADSPFVYGIGPRVITSLQADPLNYKKRALISLPKAAKIQTLAILEAGTDQAVFEVAATDGNWKDALKEVDESMREAATFLVQNFRTLRVRSYLHGTFMDIPEQPWKYRLVAEIALPGGGENTVVTREIFLTDRLSGSRQIGAMKSPPATFFLTQDYVDALTVLTGEADSSVEEGSDGSNASTPEPGTQQP